jgi:hypothetical protein
VKGNIPAYFGDCAGDIHNRILERMQQVLAEDTQYPYLMRRAVCRLGEAREVYAKSGMAERPLICLGGKMWALFPWLGSYAFLALERFLKIRCGKRLGMKGLNPARPYYLQFTMQVSEAEFYRIAALGYLIMLPACLFMGFNVFGSGLFTAFGNGVVSGLLSFIRSFVILTCCLYGLTALFGGPGLWSACPAAEVLSAFVTAYALNKYRSRYQYL